MKKELGMYELILLLKFNSTEQNIAEKIDYYKKFLTEKGSQVMAKNCGKKSLAYMIKGFDSAVSVQLVFLGNGDIIKLLNTEIKRDETILRAVTTKLVDQNLSEDYLSLLQ